MTAKESNAIKEFRVMLDDSQIPRIDILEHQYLLPWYQHIKSAYADSWTGILIMDRQGIYTPIEKYDSNIIHLMRLPKLNVPVYALTDLRFCVYTMCDSITLIFQGVSETAKSGYNFINNEFFNRPVPGISFDRSLIIPHLIRIGKDEVQLIEEDDAGEDYDND